MQKGAAEELEPSILEDADVAAWEVPELASMPEDAGSTTEEAPLMADVAARLLEETREVLLDVAKPLVPVLDGSVPELASGLLELPCVELPDARDMLLEDVAATPELLEDALSNWRHRLSTHSKPSPQDAVESHSANCWQDVAAHAPREATATKARLRLNPSVPMQDLPPEPTRQAVPPPPSHPPSHP